MNEILNAMGVTTWRLRNDSCFPSILNDQQRQALMALRCSEVRDAQKNHWVLAQDKQDTLLENILHAFNINLDNVAFLKNTGQHLLTELLAQRQQQKVLLFSENISQLFKQPVNVVTAWKSRWLIAPSLAEIAQSVSLKKALYHARLF